MGLFDKCRSYTRAKEAQAAGLYPYFTEFSSRAGSVVELEGRPVIMIGSNNYLGLTQHERVKDAARKALEKYGTSCTGSRFLNGTLDLHVQLEEKLSRFFGMEQSIVFSTGYQTNLGVISGLVGRGGTVILDSENHASIFDAAQMAHAKIVRYRHNNMEHLREVLRQIDSPENSLLITDGVFSMGGDIADLAMIVEFKKEFGFHLMVDDAHGVGVLGKTGRGTCEFCGVKEDVDLIVGTFSKSLASLGGFVCGAEPVLHYLKHHSRPLIFSASIPPSNVAAAHEALCVVDEEPDLRQQLWDNVRFAKKGLRQIGFDVGDSQSAVVPVYAFEFERCMQFWRNLLDRGVYTNPVIPPATPPGRELLRTSYMSTHTREHLEQVLDVFREHAETYGIPGRAAEEVHSGS